MADRTHSHDTSTPAMSDETVPSEEFVPVPREPTQEMKSAILDSLRYDSDIYVRDDETIVIETIVAQHVYEAMIAAAPAPNPSPAAKGGEAEALRTNIEAFLDMHRKGVLVPPTPAIPIELLEKALTALATPSPQPADAVREALADAKKAERHRIFRLLWDHSEHVNAYPLGLLVKDDASVIRALPPLAALAPDPAPAADDRECVCVRERLRRDGVFDWQIVSIRPERITMLRSFGPGQKGQEAARAALASDPAPAGEAVEPVEAQLALKEATALAVSLFNQHYRSNEDYTSGRVTWKPFDDIRGVISQIDNMTAGLSRHPAPEDTARLRKDLERESKESYEIGKRDGYEKAVQHIDERTGGDGVYCYCMGFDEDDRHCPDPQSMIARIVGRFEALSEQTNVANRERDDARKALEAVRDILDYSIDYHHQGMGCGLEDRNVTDRYEAMRYGWDEALDRFHDEVIKFAIEEIDAALATEASR